MPKPVTMKDVATEAGVHQTTVSLALRNHPRIPAATVQRIQAIAERMGYRPNPLVSALIAGRRRRGQDKTATLGYVVGDPPEEGGKVSVHTYRDLYSGARSRAEELGYGMDVLWLGDPQLSRLRFHDIAQARAIHGLIIAPLSSHHLTLEIAWERFACVAYGYSMAQPRIHRVCPDFYHSMLDLLERSRSKGLHRIGLVMDSSVDAKSDHFWLAAFLADQRIHSSRGNPNIPPLLLRDNRLDGAEAWIGKHRPQAVVGLSRLLVQVRELTASLGGDPPDHWLALDSELRENPSAFEGVVLDRHAAGAACVDVVASLLHRNERGLPKIPQNILLETGWAEAERDPVPS